MTDDREVEGRAPNTVILKINITASYNQLLRDGRMPIECGAEKRRVPIFCMLVVDKDCAPAEDSTVLTVTVSPSLAA